MGCLKDKLEELKNKKVTVTTIKETFTGQLLEIGEDYIVIDKDKIVNMNSVIYINEYKR